MKTLLTIAPEKELRIQKQARLRGLPFATLCRVLIYEKLEELENVPAAACKHQASTSTTAPNTEGVANG